MSRSACRVALVVLTFVLLSTTLVARSYGQKLYVFCEADERAVAFDEDKNSTINIGRGLKTAADSLKKAFTDHMSYDRLVVYNKKDSPWRGPNLRFSDDVARDMLVAIEECPATPEDTIFFYWSGHGEFNEYGHFLRVPSSRNSFSTMSLPRRALVDALQSKGARLTVLFTDSCFVFREVEPRWTPSLVSPAVPLSPLFESLFFEPEGFIDFNSSSPGQPSWTDPKRGGFCTQTLVDALRQKLNDSEVGWSEIFAALNVGTLEEMEKKGLSRFRIQQKVFCWSTPPFKTGEKWTLREDRWSKSTDHPKPGDRVVEVNARRVDHKDQFEVYLADAWEHRDGKPIEFTLNNGKTVKLDGSPIVLTLVDGKDGSTFYLMTNPAPASEFGYTFEPSDDQGAVLRSVDKNAPGAKCWFFK